MSFLIGYESYCHSRILNIHAYIDNHNDDSDDDDIDDNSNDVDVE